MAGRGAIVTGGIDISLRSATIGWPTGSLNMQTKVTTVKDHHQQFILSDLNVTIPRGGLTLISGPLGSGKTLFVSLTPLFLIS